MNMQHMYNVEKRRKKTSLINMIKSARIYKVGNLSLLSFLWFSNYIVTSRPNTWKCLEGYRRTNQRQFCYACG